MELLARFIAQTQPVILKDEEWKMRKTAQKIGVFVMEFEREARYNKEFRISTEKENVTKDR